MGIYILFTRTHTSDQVFQLFKKKSQNLPHVLFLSESIRLQIKAVHRGETYAWVAYLLYLSTVSYSVIIWTQGKITAYFPALVLCIFHMTTVQRAISVQTYLRNRNQLHHSQSLPIQISQYAKNALHFWMKTTRKPTHSSKQRLLDIQCLKICKAKSNSNLTNLNQCNKDNITRQGRAIVTSVSQMCVWTKVAIGETSSLNSV